jgi:hypothetical protein
MTTSEHRLQRLGIVGLCAGLLLAATATVFAGELSGMLRGYGLMLAGSAVYLLGGLRLVAWRRGAVTRQTAASVSSDLVHQS